VGTLLAVALRREAMSTPTTIVRSVGAVARPPLSRSAREILLCVGLIAVSLGVGLATQLFLPPDRVTILAVTGGYLALSGSLAGGHMTDGEFSPMSPRRNPRSLEGREE